MTLSTISASGSAIEPLLSSQLLVLGNLLRRGAELRYERLLGLSKAEFGIVAMLGRREPIPVRELAALLGMDKAQLSRALGLDKPPHFFVNGIHVGDGGIARDLLPNVLSDESNYTHYQLDSLAQ